MSEFEVQCDYSRKKKMKFFNDQEPKKYHGFLVEPKNIPDECLHFTKDKMRGACWIWILDDLVKGAGIDFGSPYGKITEYKFIINLGGEKVAKFNTNNKNWMVLKTKDYFENTVKKIGFWDSENYFYESKKKPEKPTKRQNNNPTKAENKTDWGKIALICLPIIIVAFFIFLVTKSVSKKNKSK